MKKSLIVFGMFGGLANVALAQSSVNVYGLVDMGYVYESGGVAGSVSKLTSSVANGSRLGFRGSEDLGGGLSANFVLESGFQMDTGTLGQGGAIFGRQAFVGLKGGFGSVNFGRQYTPHYLAVLSADPFNNGLAGSNAHVMAISGGRTNNAINYKTPDLSGFSAELAYGFGEAAGSFSHNNAYGAALRYAAGPFDIRLAHHNKNSFTAATNTTAESDTDAKNTILALTYNFGVAKAYLGYGINKGLNSSPFSAANPYGAAVAPASSTDSRDMLVGLSVPFGPHTIVTSYIRKDDKDAANRDAHKTSVGYLYALSKRTTLYASYAAINNKNNAAYTVGSAVESGSGNKAANFGVQHRF